MNGRVGYSLDSVIELRRHQGTAYSSLKARRPNAAGAPSCPCRSSPSPTILLKVLFPPGVPVASRSCAPSKRLCLILLLFWFLAPRAYCQEPGLLRIGADIDYRPYSYVDSLANAAGFDIEVMRLLAERLGLRPEFRLERWDAVLEDLRKERLDVVAGALFTISRTESFIFTSPYNTDIISIFVRDGSEDRHACGARGKDRGDPPGRRNTE